MTEAAASSSCNIVSLLRGAAEAYPERAALVEEGMRGGECRSVTYGELWERVQRISVGLRRIGLRPGDRAIIMVPMSVELYAVLLAVVKLGAAAVFVDPWLSGKRIAAFAGHADARAFIGVPKAHMLRLVHSELRQIELSITTGVRVWRLPARWSLKELETGRAADSEAAAIEPVSTDTDALITFTSGSSGEPKGSQRTHGFLLAQHRALARVFPQQKGSVDMTHFPVFALNNLAAGVATLIPRVDFSRIAATDGEGLLATMRGAGVATCTLSPALLDRLADAFEAGALGPGLQRILVGGAPISDPQLRRWMRVLPSTEITVVYGSTEAEPVAHISAAERLKRHAEANAHGICCGRPVSEIRCRVLKLSSTTATSDAPAHEIGELAVCGDHVGRSYYRNPRAQAENKVMAPNGDCWHRMGDTGSFDDSGNFWLAGRVHTVIRRAGALWHSTAAEQLACRVLPEAKQIAAVGVADGALGEALVLVVHGGAAFPESALPEPALAAAFMEAGIPLDHVLTSPEPLPVDPRHNTKIDYDELKRRLAKNPPKRQRREDGNE